MKSNKKLIMLAFALSSALFLSGCDEFQLSSDAKNDLCDALGLSFIECLALPL